MNKLTKLLSVFVIAGAVGTGVSFAAGCGHKHSFSEDWTSDETTHWHAANCEHSDEKADVADHKDDDNNFLCDECGYDLATHVTRVTLNATSKTLKIGEEFQLEATVLPANASIKTYTWKSSDTAVAEVVNGKVTAKAAGTADITVTTTDGARTEKCTITVEDDTPATVAVTGITLDKTELSLKVGEQEQIRATVAPENATNKKRTRVSSDETVATIDSNGIVTAVGEGTATITVKTEDGGFEATCTVTVSPATRAVTGVSLKRETLELEVGDTDEFVATVTPENATNKKVTFTSSDPTVATMDGDTITALKAGTTTITVTTADGNYTATCAVTVKERTSATVAVTGITLDKDTVNLKVGETDKITATVAPANATNKSRTRVSSNPAVATIDADGTITAVGEGTAIITVKTVDGGFEATCTVNVSPATIAVTGVTLNKNTLSLQVGATDELVATIAPADATNKKVTFTSSDSTVVSVDGSEITALKAGTATITVTTADGNHTAQCVVTVTGSSVVVPETVTIDLGTNNLALKKGETAEVELKLDSSYVGKKLYIYSYNEVELTVTGSTAAGSGVLVTYAAGLKVSVKYTGEEDGEAEVYVCPVLAMGENEVTAAVGSTMFAVYTEKEVEELTVSIVGDTDDKVGFRSKFGTELATETTAYVENGIAIIILMNNGESSKTVTLNVAEPEEEEPEFNGTEIKLDEATDFTADGLGYSLFKVELTAGSYTLNFTGCDAADLDIAVGLSFNAYDEVEDTIEAEGGVYTLAEGATVYIGLMSIKDDWDDVVAGKLTVSEAKEDPTPEEKMTEAQYVAAIDAFVNSTNFTLMNGDTAIYKVDGDKIYLGQSNSYVVYNAETKTATEYKQFGKDKDVLIKSAYKQDGDKEVTTYESVGEFIKAVTHLQEMKTGLVTFATSYDEDVAFDEGVYTVNGINLTFADGKLASYEAPIGEGMTMTVDFSYGTTVVTLEGIENAYDPVFNSADLHSDRLDEYAGSVVYGLYAESNTDDNYVGATENGYAQKIKVNQKIYVSFAGLTGDIKGYFELSADAFGSSWNLMQFMDTADKPVFTMASGSEKEGKFTFSNVEGKSVQLTVNKKSKFAYIIKKVEDNYKLTLTIDGNTIVTDADLGANAISNITLVSSSSGGRKLTIDNVLICGEKQTVDKFRTDVQAKIDAVYLKMVGREAGEGVEAIVGTHTKNAEIIKDVYDNLKLSEKTTFDEIADAANGFLTMQVESDAVIKAAADKAQEKIDVIKADEVKNKYTQLENKDRYEQFITNAENILKDAKSVAQINEYFFDVEGGETALFDKDFAEIPTDEALATMALNAAKASARETLKATAEAYIATCDLTEIKADKLAEVTSAIEAAWTTANTSVNTATSASEVETAMTTFDSAVETAIANASDSIAAKKTAAAKQLATDTDKAIKDAGLDKNDPEIQELIYNEFITGDGLPIGLLPRWQAKILADDVTDETTLASRVADATFAIYKAYAPLQLQAEFDKATAAVNEAQSEEIANGYKLYQIATSNSELNEARQYITDRSNAIYGYESTIKDAQETISSPETTDKAKIEELMETIISKLTSMSDTAVPEITAKIAEIKEFTFKVTIEGVEGITVDDVKIGEAVVLKGSEPDNVMIKSWYWYVPVLNSPTGEMKTELYDFTAPVFDDITIHASTAKAIKTNINNAFSYAAIKTDGFGDRAYEGSTAGDSVYLKQSDFDGTANSFLTINGYNEDSGSSNVVWRKSNYSCIQNRNGGLSFYYAGGGTVTLTIEWCSTGDKNESRLGLKGEDGKYIAATTPGGTLISATEGADAVDNGTYSLKGVTKTTTVFTLTEKGTYTIWCPDSVTTRGARITKIELKGYSKEEVIDVTGVTIGLADAEAEWATDNTYDVSEGSLELTATVAPGNATYTDVTWTSSDKTVATVANGVVTFIKKGTVTITVTSTSNSEASDTVDLTVTDSELDAAIEAAKTALANKYPAANYKTEEYNGQTIGNTAAYEQAYNAAITAIEAATTEDELTAAVSAAETALGAIQTTEDLKKVQYDVKFYDGSTTPATEYTVLATQVAEDGKVTKPADPEKPGYKFIGWYKESTFETEFKFGEEETGASANIDIYAKFVEAYTVNFYVDGEKVQTDVIEKVAEGNTLATDPEFTNDEGKTFDGYYTAEDYTGTKWVFTTALTADNTDSNRVLNLYARWVMIYTVTFKDGDTTVATPEVMKNGYAEAPELSTKIVTNGTYGKYKYNLIGWFAEDATEAFDFATAITVPVTLTAHWELVEQHNFVETNSGDAAKDIKGELFNFNMSSRGSVRAASSITGTTTVLTNSSSFAYGINTSNGTVTFTANKDIKLYAYFTIGVSGNLTEAASGSVKYKKNGGDETNLITIENKVGEVGVLNISLVKGETVEVYGVSSDRLYFLGAEAKLGYEVKVTGEDAEVVDGVAKLALEDTLQLTANVTDYDGDIIWTSSDETVATVVNGLVTAQAKKGLVTITATADGFSGTYTINVGDFLKDRSALLAKLNGLTDTEEYDDLQEGDDERAKGRFTAILADAISAIKDETNGEKLGESDDYYYTLLTDILNENFVTVTLKYFEGDEAKAFVKDGKDVTISAYAKDTVKDLAPDTAEAPFAKSGSEFVAWCTDEGLENEFDFDKDTFTADMTVLYAKYASSCKVTFIYDNGNDSEDVPVANGGTVSAEQVPAPTKTGYVFKGWFVVEDGEMTSTEFNLGETTVNGDVTVKAKWAAVQKYDITVNEYSNNDSIIENGNLFNLTANNSLKAIAGESKDHTLPDGTSVKLSNYSNVLCTVDQIGANGVNDANMFTITNTSSGAITVKIYALAHNGGYGTNRTVDITSTIDSVTTTLGKTNTTTRTWTAFTVTIPAGKSASIKATNPSNNKTIICVCGIEAEEV